MVIKICFFFLFWITIQIVLIENCYSLSSLKLWSSSWAEVGWITYTGLWCSIEEIAQVYLLRLSFSLVNLNYNKVFLIIFLQVPYFRNELISLFIVLMSVVTTILTLIDFASSFFKEVIIFSEEIVRNEQLMNLVGN